MYLKKIQLVGFKSFPDKTIIELEDNITAIVGPNGSGKSNLLDGIRWALGEQSTKMLRGQKMEDIIFAGSDNRRRLGLAEVILTFDNEDGHIPLEYQEVSIKRKIFRAGDSEYYINNNKCRLKDIREIFMDTGVGTDGYSIIGQGKIDEILSNKPDERRYIFEEAAGITKYKTKKEEAEKKLFKTDENLERINDILFELNKQHKYLEKEACKTSDYNEFIEEYEAYKKEILIRKTNRYKTNVLEIDNKIKLLIKEFNDIEVNLSNLTQEIFELESKLSIYKKDNNDIKLKKEEDLRKILKLENEKNLLLESKKHLDREFKELIKNKELLLKQLNDNENNIYLIKKEIDIKIEEEQNLKQKFKKLKKEIDLKIIEFDKKELEVEKEKDHLIEFYKRITDNKAEKTNLNNFKKNLEDELNTIEEFINIKEKDIIDLNNEVERIENDLEIISKDHIINREEINDLRNNFDKLNKEKKEVLNKIENNNIILNLNESKIDMNLNMDENYEGYYRSVKTLMIDSKKDPILKKNIEATVGDVISVPHSYSLAIDIALGNTIQNIITKDKDSAKILIEYLKINNIGRATFLPLDTIKSRYINIENLELSKYKCYGIASDLVECDKKYKNIIENLLGRVLIVKNMDSGINLFNQLKSKMKIVTLDGDIINPGGSMTGGAVYKKNNNVLSRKSLVTEMKKENENIREENLSLNKDIDILIQDIDKIVTDIKIKEEQFKTTNIDILKLENEYQNKKADRSREKINIKDMEKKKIIIISKIKDLNNKMFLIEEGLKNLDVDNLNLQSNINKLIKEIESNKNKRERYIKEITDYEITLNNLKNIIQNLEDDKTRLFDQEKIFKKELEKRTMRIEENKLENIKVDSKIEKLKIKKIENEKYYENILEKEKDIVNKIKTFEEKLEFKRDKFIEIDKLNLVQKEKINNLKIKLAEKNIYLKNNLDDLNKLGIKDISNYHSKLDNMDNETISKNMISLNSKISELGNINLNAIEEFKAIDERLTFINDQVSDLIESKESLNKIIKNMSQKMNKEFKESFKKIQNNFNEVFKELFNGGKAELILEEKEDLLNSGIEIKAQPPGKKFQTLSLLSGGERSLTAVALLFSILKIKPTPFCILDEIDAALDDTNIKRYTKYLEKFSEETQFIMITHRKPTMEIADILYGVTMQEKGVSRLIPVKLSDYK